MLRKLLYAIPALLCGALGFAASYFFYQHPRAEDPTDSTPIAVPEKVKLITDTTDTRALTEANTKITQLTAERDALQAELARAQAAAQEAQTATPPAVATPPQKADVRLSPAERMEKLKQEDPERYAELQKRREQFQQQMMLAQENRDNFLNDIDLSLMTPAQQEVHAAYTTALARQNELFEVARTKFESGEEFTDEERAEMFENRRIVRELQGQERTALLNAVGTSMGFTAEESEDFVALIEEVFSVTQGTGVGRPRGEMPPPAPEGNPPPPGRF